MTQPIAPIATTAVDTDVVIVGAGLAGLGAATALRERGLRCVVLEASNRIGGRAWTTHPPELAGAWFDHGAIWFHDAANNPLTPIAEAAGLPLLRSDELRQERTYVGARLANAAELADYDAAWSRFEAMADALITRDGDASMAAVTAALPDDPWAPTIEAWEAAVICAAPAERFSARDWRRNALGGFNLVPDGGIGAFVQGHLGSGLDIRLNTPVERVRSGGPAGRVDVVTRSGTVSARACVVTVSTGVLAAGTIAFEPALPARTLEAIAALPMGLAIKVVLRANGPDRLDLPTHCSIERMVGRTDDPFMPIQAWPFGRDYVQGWIGGPLAWDLSGAGDAAIFDHGLAQLRALFGHRVDKLFAGGARLRTHWDADPWVRGAYCYALPHQAEARDRLAEPLADGHLMLAGEGCNVPYAGTVAGAWISGRDAAVAIAARLSAR